MELYLINISYNVQTPITTIIRDTYLDVDNSQYIIDVWRQNYQEIWNHIRFINSWNIAVKNWEIYDTN